MIHHVFACKSNIGDWLSARGIQTLLSPWPIAEYLCDEPFVPATLARLAEADVHDVIVVGGGGLFMDYFAPFWEGLVAISQRVPVCLWGVGYCDGKRSSSRASVDVLRRIVGASHLVVVRDWLSHREFADLRLPEPIGCPSTLMLRPSTMPARGLLHVVHYDVVGPSTYEEIDRAARAFASRSGRPYQQTDNQIRDGDEEELTDRLARYAAADLVLTSRLHGCIIALAMGRKVLAVSGDWKIEAFMNSVGLGMWALEPDELNRLGERLEALPSQPSVQDRIEQIRQANRSVAGEILRLAERGQSACHCAKPMFARSAHE